MEDKPKCVDCGEEMPWLMSSKIRDSYYCEKDEKLVIRESETGELRWFATIFTPKEIICKGN